MDAVLYYILCITYNTIIFLFLFLYFNTKLNDAYYKKKISMSNLTVNKKKLQNTYTYVYVI